MGCESAVRVSARVSVLLGLPVCTEDGALLGRVADIRCSTADGARRPTPVDAIVYGRLGWLERIGLRGVHERIVAAGDVVRMERDRVVVRATPAPRPPTGTSASDGAKRRPRPRRESS
jgi:sporulation protein YlmC with PRC-barrel domain